MTKRCLRCGREPAAASSQSRDVLATSARCPRLSTTWTPKVDYPPIRFFRFSPRMMDFGVEIVRTRRGSFSIFGQEKTIYDSLRHRIVVGQDVVIEALHTHLRSPRIRNIDRVIRTVRRGRVEKRIRSFLEALA